MKTCSNKLEALYERFRTDFRIDPSLVELNAEAGELLYTAPKSNDSYKLHAGELCNVDLYHGLCRLTRTDSNILVSEVPLPEIQNIEVLFRAWYKMNRESHLEEGKSVADVLRIASVYLNVNTVWNPYDPDEKEYYYGLVVTLQNEKAIPLLAQFKGDGTLMPVAHSSLGNVATYYYGDVGQVKQYNTRGLITRWAKEFNKGNLQSYVLSENVLGFILNFDSPYTEPLDNLALSMGREEGFSLEEFTIGNFPEVPAKIAHLLPAKELSFSFLYDFLDVFNNIINTRVKGVAEPAPASEEMEDESMPKAVIGPYAESLDTTQDEAAKKEQPCASCIDTIIKNADLGISDAQRYAIVGLMAVAFNMEIPD